MKKPIALLVALCISFLLGGCSEKEQDPEWSETYQITGTEHTQMWVLNADSFLSSINALITEDGMKLDYLKEYDPTSSNCMLTKNGTSWKILLDIFSESEASASWFKNTPASTEWVGNIESVELSLSAKDTKASEENGYYVRYLISIFTPGAENEVEEKIGLYGDPDQSAVIDVGVNQIEIGNVLYSYTSDGRFIVEPRIEDWPTEESAPAAIRPK